jgi:DNA-binding transcriptional LysR family regulator
MSNEIKFSSLRPRPVSIFCNHKHPFADRTDLQLSDLYEFPVTFLSSIARYVMNKRIIGIDFSENFITTNSPDMVIQLVKGTNTIGILIHEDIEPFVRDGTFVTLNVQEIQQDLYSRFGVAVNSSVVSSKTTERFITELVEFDKKTYE